MAKRLGIFSKGVESSLAALNEKVHSLPKTDFLEEELHSAATHLLNDSAKLVRPAIVLATAEIFDGNPKRFVDLALAIELLHVSSLIHDDIIDGDKRRRGVETVHDKFGNEMAILSGDALIAKATTISALYGGKVTSFIARAAMEMCAGEALDYKFHKSKKAPTEKEYCNMVRMKCASLIAASAALVPVYLGSDQIENLYTFGENVGMAFQIKDDIEDFGEGDGNRQNLIKILEAGGITNGDAKEHAKRMAGRYLEMGLNALPAEDRFSQLKEYAIGLLTGEGAISRQ
jgi:geranylgeranyl pyrophosphate synthase